MISFIISYSELLYVVGVLSLLFLYVVGVLCIVGFWFVFLWTSLYCVGHSFLVFSKIEP